MADYILDKGYPVRTDYNTNAVAGVTAFRAVKFSPQNNLPTIDIQTTASAGAPVLGVVQENVDAVKVTTGKVVADVRLLGVSKVYVTTGTSIGLGTKVMAGANGGVLLATTGSSCLGTVVAMSTTSAPATGDLIDILLTPGALA